MAEQRDENQAVIQFLLGSTGTGQGKGKQEETNLLNFSDDYDSKT